MAASDGPATLPSNVVAATGSQACDWLKLPSRKRKPALITGASGSPSPDVTSYNGIRLPPSLPPCLLVCLSVCLSVCVRPPRSVHLLALAACLFVIVFLTFPRVFHVIGRIRIFQLSNLIFHPYQSVCVCVCVCVVVCQCV